MSTPDPHLDHQPTAPDRPDALQRLEDMLNGLAIFEAHLADDEQALAALLSEGTCAAQLRSVLTAFDALVEALSATSEHGTTDLVSALRRQIMRSMSEAGAES